MMKAWQHFKTITTHKIWVMRYCFKIGLYWQGLTHDLSKYSPTEFLVGMKYYQGDRSPNNAEREDTGMSKSWMHHKGRNKHHFEYWIDYGINCDTIIKGVPMPRRYVAEMIMDRISASRVYLGDAYTDQAPYQYLKKGIGHLWFVHPETLSQLEFLLRMLSERGEDDTLYYIRHHFLKGRITLAVTDILENRVRKQEHILLDDAQILVNGPRGHGPDILSVNADGSAGHIVKPGDKLT